MKAESQQPRGREDVIEELNATITSLAENVSSIAPTKIVFGSVVILLTLFRVCFPFFRQDLL